MKSGFSTVEMAPLRVQYRLNLSRAAAARPGMARNAAGVVRCCHDLAYLRANAAFPGPIRLPDAPYPDH